MTEEQTQLINMNKNKSKRKMMSNPKNFCRIANNIGVYYEHLHEIKESSSTTALARLFEGNSARGGINSTCIDSWINTFEYIRENPNHVDNDIPMPFSMKPTKEYFDYVKNISQVISDDVIKSWENLSNKKLGIEAEKYHYCNGTKNSTALKTLPTRMKEMVERRRVNIWNKTFDIKEIKEIKEKENKKTSDSLITSFNKENNNYNMMNVPELRALCKERNLPNAHLKNKCDIVTMLEEKPNNNLLNIIEIQQKEILELKEKIKNLEQQILLK